MNWIFVFIAGINATAPAADDQLAFGNHADTPTVIARYVSEEKCQAGRDAFNKALNRQTKSFIGNGNYLCLPVGASS